MKNLCGILLILHILAGALLAQEPPVRAVIVETSGQARLKQPGQQPVAVEPLMRVYEGTALEVSDRGLVEAYRLLDGRRYEVLGPCLIRVGHEGVEVLKGRADCVRWIESAGKGDLVDPSHAPGRGQQDQKLQLRFTSNGDVPTFSWDTQLPGPYWVRVFTTRTGEVDTVVWSASTNNNEIRYAGPPLEKDRSYVWQVAADKTLSSARFRVFSTGALDSFQRTETELTQWSEAHPTDPGVLVVMALLYDQNDEPKKALAALQKAQSRQTSEVRQRAVDVRMSQLARETSTKADSQFDPFNSASRGGYMGGGAIGRGYMGPGYMGSWNYGYPGWGGYSPWF